MRDLLSYDPAADTVEPAPDPVRRAAEHARVDLPKRFYETATVGRADDGWRVLLDGRPVRTPARRILALPDAGLAEAVAAEWAAQGRTIDPRSMPHTRLANAVVDGVVERAAEVADDLLNYAGTDLVCYRATEPERLVGRQTALWDPILDWAEEAYGARFLVADGVMHVAQDAEALAAVAAPVRGLDPWRLAGLHAMTTITGSVLIALARAAGRLDADAAWTAATVDEAWNIELWGADAEAVARLAARRREFDAAAAFAGAP